LLALLKILTELKKYPFIVEFNFFQDKITDAIVFPAFSYILYRPANEARNFSLEEEIKY